MLRPGRQTDSPRCAGRVAHPDRWRQVLACGADLSAAGGFPVLSFGVVRRGRTTGVHTYHGSPDGESSSSSSGSDAPVFLIASLTKPVVAMASLLLVERGLLSLNDRVSEFIPDFSGADRRGMTIRHLLTHTSGLPDMLPNNRALRAAQSPLDRFVAGTCGVTLDFPPGRGVQYQSMGFVLLGDVIQRVSGVSCGEFLQRELFEPLGMCDTRLGLAADDPLASRIEPVRLPPEQADGHDWNWNSRYWRALGAPWGGMLSTVQDLLIFCRMILQRGRYAGQQVFSPATVLAATTNQLDAFHDVPETDRRTRGWGFGWRMNWLAHNSCFSDLLSPGAFGHWGATGTVFWIDPARDAAAVILSSQPLDLGSGPGLTRLSNRIAAAL